MSTTFYYLSIPAIKCSSCAEPVRNAILKNNKVSNVLVNHGDKRIVVIIEHDDNEQLSQIKNQILHNLSQIRFPATEVPLLADNDDGDGDFASSHKMNPILARLKSIFTSHWLYGLLGLGSGLILMLLPIFFTAGLSLPVLATIGAISSLLILALGAPFYLSAINSYFKAKTLTMDVLFSISTLTIIVASIGAFFVPWLPMMFEAGLLIFGFRHIGIAIEDSLKRKIAGENYQDRLPTHVHVWSNNVLVKRHLNNVQVGDIIVINPGEIIPLDGVCLSKNGLIDESIENGNASRRILLNEELLSGMRLLNCSRGIQLRVTKTVSESNLAVLDRELIQGLAQQSKIEKNTSQILQLFIPIVLLIAISSLIIVSLFCPPVMAFQCAVSVLASACPCIIGIVASIATKLAFIKANKYNVQFKSAQTLQSAADISFILFDINGTLTTGIQTVESHGYYQQHISSEELLEYFAAVESAYATEAGSYTHPTAHALLKYVNKKLTHTAALTVQNLDSSNHSGLTAIINGQEVVIGNETMMRDKGINIERLKNRLRLKSGEQAIYLARNKQVHGYMILTDPFRDDAIHTLQLLRKQYPKTKIGLISGAGNQFVHDIAKELNIPANQVWAECKARYQQDGDNSKKAIIRTLNAQGEKVMMVGDGGNDAQAFAACAFSIAMKSKSGDQTAQATAGAVIRGKRLLPVVTALAIAKQTMYSIKKNISLSLVYNLGMVLVASGIFIGIGLTVNPVVGAGLMVLQAIIILISIYSLKTEPLPHLSKQAQSYPVKESYEHFYNYMPEDTPGPTFSTNPKVSSESSRPTLPQTQQEEITIEEPHWLANGFN